MRKLSSTVESVADLKASYDQLYHKVAQGHLDFQIKLRPWAGSILKMMDKWECSALDAYYGCCYRERVVEQLTTEKLELLQAALYEIHGDQELPAKQIKWSKKKEQLFPWLKPSLNGSSVPAVAPILSLPDTKETIVGEQVEQMPAREIAAKMLGVMSSKTPHSSKWLARKAGLERQYDRERFVGIMKVLESAGKIAKEEGKWILV